MIGRSATIPIVLSGLLLAAAACEGHGRREVAREEPARPVEATWWAWTLEQIQQPDASVAPDARSEETWDGPPAADVRAPLEPPDVARGDGGDEVLARKAGRVIWVLRHP